MMHYKRVFPFFLLILCFGFSACGPNSKNLNTSGIEKLKNEDYEGALEDFTKAVEKDPEFAESYLNRGFVYGNRGELQEALADFNKAIEIDSGYVEAYYNRGFIYGFFEEFDKAMADFDKVIELNPKDAEAYINRALIRSRIGDREGELADLKKAAALGDPTARNWLDDNGVEWEDAGKGSDSAEDPE
ncbi:MAG: tetratricopeptide repeat protein [Chlorobium sp.]|nr:tetratricopeptide repeat protein [Chlorobium sp.]MCW8814594.1 tetratricopeptide repeat protein [Chlorobium sp.]MCW8819322.1 tetratricopeptide repeat protein [Ignavibacteriaceae bacterium]